jgi:RNA polymerase sigma factor (sigma-70 family)
VPLTSDDIAQLYRRQARQLAGFFVRRTQDPEVAVDLVAETFASVVRDREQFRGDTDEAAVAWMFGIARNLLNGWYRNGDVERRAMNKLGIERAEFTEGEYDRLVELGGLAETREQVARGLRELPDDQQQAIALRVVGERSYEEVAGALGISQQVARARVSRGLRSLAALLDDSVVATEVNGLD